MSTTTLTQENIIKKVYDPGTETLKVNAIATLSPGILEITITDQDDSIKVGGGDGNYILPNPDGSVNVNVTSNGRSNKNLFDEIGSVASGVTSTIISYVAPANTKIISADFGGDNIAMYSLHVDGILTAKKYSFWGGLNERFNFSSGMSIPTGAVITVEVVHDRDSLGMFFCNLLVEN